MGADEIPQWVLGALCTLQALHSSFPQGQTLITKV